MRDYNACPTCGDWCAFCGRLTCHCGEHDICPRCGVDEWPHKCALEPRQPRWLQWTKDNNSAKEIR